jgi:hypothetical protein
MKSGETGAGGGRVQRSILKYAHTNASDPALFPLSTIVGPTAGAAEGDALSGLSRALQGLCRRSKGRIVRGGRTN